MSWGIRRIVNGCARQLLVVRRDVIAPEFLSDGLVIRAINRKVCRCAPGNIGNKVNRQHG